jgi:hypothetical protein
LVRGAPILLKPPTLLGCVIVVFDAPASFLVDALMLPFDLADEVQFDREWDTAQAQAAEADRVVSAVPNQRGLADLAIGDPRPTVREAAISRLTEQAELARVATAGTAWAQRRSAIERLTDPTVLRALLDADLPAWIKGAARDRLNDLTMTEGRPATRP